MTYEEAIKELEKIISKLESGNVPMSEAISLFERGEELAKICYNHLSSAKGKLTLVKEELGKLVETDDDDF